MYLIQQIKNPESKTLGLQLLKSSSVSANLKQIPSEGLENNRITT